MAGEDWQGVDLHFLERRAGDIEAAAAALEVLREELEAKGGEVKEGSWGYRLLIVEDLDGNQLLFNYPNETASADCFIDGARVRSTLSDYEWVAQVSLLRPGFLLANRS